MMKLKLPPLFEEAAFPKEVPREPTRVFVSLSGGKDSVASLLLALEVSHFQVVLEDFVGTVEYCRSVCHFLGVPFSFSQGVYNSFLCLACGHKHLSIFFEEAYCHKCGSRDKQFLGVISGIHDYIRHRSKWMGGTVRPCTKNFKIDVWNTWARENVRSPSYCASEHTYCANLCKVIVLIKYALIRPIRLADEIYNVKLSISFAFSHVSRTVPGQLLAMSPHLAFSSLTRDKRCIFHRRA